MPAALQIVNPGPLTLIEDLGRPDLAWAGVARSGAADRESLALANRLVGNDSNAAGLEVLLGGLTFVVTDTVDLAVTGASTGLTINGRSLDLHRAHRVAAGSIVELGRVERGLRNYLAVRGGIVAEPVLGSQSRDVLAAIGPAPVAKGDLLTIGSAASLPAWYETVAPPPRPSPVVLRVAPGPRISWFDDWSRTAGITGPWTVLPASDRTGVRLSGTSLTRRAGDLPSEPTLVGAVQVPPDGQPIVLGPDCGVTGGYPVIAVVLDADLDRLFQVRPGEPVTFTTA